MWKITFSYLYGGFESDIKLTEIFGPSLLVKIRESCDSKYINYHQNIVYRKLSDKILGIIPWEFLYPLFPEQKKVVAWGMWHKPDKLSLLPEHETPQRQIEMEQNLVTPPNALFNILEISSGI